jgi:hypothetical protein
MYLNADITQVPGGYIVQTKEWDEDSEEEYFETSVFTTIEGVTHWLNEYFQAVHPSSTDDSEGGEPVEAPSPIHPILPSQEKRDV